MRRKKEAVFLSTGLSCGAVVMLILLLCLGPVRNVARDDKASIYAYRLWQRQDHSPSVKHDDCEVDDVDDVNGVVTYYVAPTGSNDYACAEARTPHCPRQTLASLAACLSGQRDKAIEILLRGGEYRQ